MQTIVWLTILLALCTISITWAYQTYLNGMTRHKKLEYSVKVLVICVSIFQGLLVILQILVLMIV
jgi:hypothetical protein